MRRAETRKGRRQFLEIVTSIDIAANPKSVWPFLVDWENLDKWMKEASDFRVISPQREGIGVEAEATVAIAGIKTRDRIRVTEWSPPVLLSLEHLGWVKGIGTIRTAETSLGTQIHWTEKLTPPWGFVGRIGMNILKPLMTRIFARDLRLLKMLIESRGATSGPTTIPTTS